MDNEFTFIQIKTNHRGTFKNITIGFLALIVIISSCDIYNQEDYQEYIVVEAYAVANSQLPVVYVSTTSPVGVEYDRESQKIRNAIVKITLIDDNGNDSIVFNYNYSLVNNSYNPRSFHSVRPNATYRLEVNFNDRPDKIRAYTTVPDEFKILNELPAGIIYQSNEQLEITISAPKSTNFPNVFVFSTISENPTEDNLTPFYRDSYENNNLELADINVNSSGLINEGNFDINPDQTITLKFPWIGVAFYGESRIVINSVDKNLADFVRSQQVQLGGSTLSPGEIPNLIYNVDGGIGIFGSLSFETAQTTFLRPLE